MGTLTSFLQSRFEEQCPRGWNCRREVDLVDAAAAARLGFAPRADVVLEQSGGPRRIWVEFEVSRADPVANHAKFATARFLEGGDASEAFVSMSSRHIAPGRAALAAGTAMMMRALGIPAFQTALLPAIDAREIKRLNALPLRELAHSARIDVAAEIGRVLQVTDALVLKGWHRIHKADNPYTVAVNVRQWNREIGDAGTAATWGRRRIRYFVFDPVSRLFAPSKFAAFVPSPQGQSGTRPFTEVREPPGAMSIGLYAALGEQDPRFDGHVARRHLEVALGYRAVELSQSGDVLRAAFEKWLLQVESRVQRSRGSAETLLVPMQ